ncbi:peptidylprolyl isomerase [Ancylobacter terrae]|uniref:peptidylprolyl isomerase n=1 Tax=Ancylobacter sp. sgz301288 TaxID=3342077 RepID=UPI00385DC576
MPTDLAHTAALLRRLPRRWAQPLRRLAWAVATLMLLGAAPASAQILVMVNGEPVTAYDVSQRIKLAQVTERQNLNQKQALDAVIDDRLKIFTAKRFGVVVDDDELNKMFANTASRTGRTPEQLTQGLAQQGVDARALKAKMRADYVWNGYVRARFSSATQVRDSDIFAAMQAKGTEVGAAVQRTTEYTIRQIVLVVPRNAAPAVRAQRASEANALRQRFSDCDSGLAAARALKETVVRDPVIRTSADVPAGLRKLLEETPVGKLTPFEVTQSGVEMVAICNKREVVGDSVQKREVRDELQNKQFETQSKRLLEEARKSSLIEYRR